MGSNPDAFGQTPWVGSSGNVAHPRSSRGGGGSGGYVIPRPLGTDGNDSAWLAHPESPAGKHLLPSDVEAAVLARPSHQKMRSTSAPKGRSKVYPVELSEFNNRGKVRVQLRGSSVFPWAFTRR